MKVFVSGDVDALKNAAAWVNNPQLRAVLGEFERRIRRQEDQWGECLVFAEIGAPHRQASKSRQIDLLVAFSDRAALCEIKQGISRGSIHYNFQFAARQINSQLDTTRDLLKRAGLDERCLLPFLWSPNISRQDLNDIIVEKGRLTFEHIAVSGANADFRLLRLADRDRNFAYFPDSIIDRLSNWTGNHQSPKHVSSVLLGAIMRNHEATEIPLLEFPDFLRLQEYLAESYEDPILVPDPDYISGLRGETLNQGLAQLSQSRFVEVLGPAGIGKTGFIRELLQNHSRDKSYAVLPPLVLHRKIDALSILRELAEHVGLYEPAQLGVLNQAQLFKQLTEGDFVYWIRDYDASSEAAVRRLAALVAASGAGGKAYWIIESMAASLPDGQQKASYQILLKPLDGRAMAKILSRRQRGAGSSDIAAVIDAAQGVPRLAIWRWTIEQLDEAMPPSERLDQYQLFLQHLSQPQKAYITPIAYMLAEAPLGCTVRLLESWCRAIQPFARGELSEVVRGALEQARSHLLISIETFGSADSATQTDGDTFQQTTRALRDQLLPADFGGARIGWIHVVDPHFVDHFVRAIAPETLAQWGEKLREVLLEASGDDLSLTGVTFALLTGDFLPFVRSGFRSSSAMLPRIKEWIHRRDQRAIGLGMSPDAAYFRHWLDWTIEHYWEAPERPDSRSAWKFPAPDNSPFQKLLYDTARTRSDFYHKDGICDLEAWAAAADRFRQEGQMELWAEAMLRRAQALVRSPYDDPRQAWSLMQSVLAEEGRLVASAGRSMLYFHVLSFLNKRKLLSGRIPELAGQTDKLVPELVNKMVEAGFAAENINSVANATFFLVRIIEFANRALTSEDAENYSVLMRFVQRVSPARRVQALLTEGTVHRHYCSTDKIGWEEFCFHAEEALAIYDRTIDAARRGGMPTHAANSLSYSGQIFQKAFRFSDQPNFQEWLEEVLPEPRKRLEAAFNEAHFVNSLRTNALNRGLLINLYKTRAVYRWLSVVLLEQDSMDSLPGMFGDARSELKKHTATLYSGERVKETQIFLNDLTRMLRATACAKSYREAVQICSARFRELINDARAISPKDPVLLAKSDLGKRLRRLEEALQAGKIAEATDG
jgi:hypothetical protein